MTTEGNEMTDEQMGQWYMLNKMGMATLCSDKAEAEQEAADAQRFWPHMGPHRAAQLVEASFEAADMATAAADGFRSAAAEVAKLKTYEELGDAADDMQLLRMGYAAARLEIESLQSQLHAAKQINAAQFTLLAASIPGAALRPPHGQAPAGAYKDSTPDLHVGDSSFESWYADYVKEGTKGLKQHCRDAYAAGMGDPLVRAAPAAVAGPSEFPHEQMDVMALARYKVMPSHESMFHRHAVVAGDGSQQLYIGREVECENMARKFAGAFLDGAFAFHSMLAAAPTTQPAPALWVSPVQFANFMDADEAEFGKYIPARKTSAGKFTMPLFAARAPADSVLEDAARLDWLDQQCEGYGFQDIHEGNRWEIGGPYANVRKAIDYERAARKQGANHD